MLTKRNGILLLSAVVVAGSCSLATGLFCAASLNSALLASATLARRRGQSWK